MKIPLWYKSKKQLVEKDPIKNKSIVSRICNKISSQTVLNKRIANHTYLQLINFPNSLPTLVNFLFSHIFCPTSLLLSYIFPSIDKLWKKNHIFTCILPDPHDITKEFGKNGRLENTLAGFLLRCQNSLLYEISLIYHWNIDSLNQDWSFVHVIVPNNDPYII